MTMESNVVKFPLGISRKAYARKMRVMAPTEVILDNQPPAGSLSTTCKNSRLRQARDKAWDRARHTTSYWRVRLDWHVELEAAQKRGLADSGSFPPAADENRFSLVDTWREAVVKQLLTPAPNVAAVAWKRAKLSGRDFSYLPVKPDRVERAIASDLAFLAAHPVRRSNRRNGASARVQRGDAATHQGHNRSSAPSSRPSGGHCVLRKSRRCSPQRRLFRGQFRRREPSTETKLLFFAKVFCGFCHI
jgi:hypothetical protein